MEFSLTLVIVLVLVFLGISAYFFLMIFYPEWVGITGPVARKNLDEHRENAVPDAPESKAESQDDTLKPSQ